MRPSSLAATSKLFPAYLEPSFYHLFGTKLHGTLYLSRWRLLLTEAYVEIVHTFESGQSSESGSSPQQNQIGGGGPTEFNKFVGGFMCGRISNFSIQSFYLRLTSNTVSYPAVVRRVPSQSNSCKPETIQNLAPISGLVLSRQMSCRWSPMKCSIRARKVWFRAINSDESIVSITLSDVSEMLFDGSSSRLKVSDGKEKKYFRVSRSHQMGQHYGLYHQAFWANCFKAGLLDRIRGGPSEAYLILQFFWRHNRPMYGLTVKKGEKYTSVSYFIGPIDIIRDDIIMLSSRKKSLKEYHLVYRAISRYWVP